MEYLLISCSSLVLVQTTTKKKITSAFGFTRWLDMGKRLSNPPPSGLIYELSAILIHKGSAANSGHYVAHIKDENSGQWWEFDDEHVSNLGYHPFGETSKANVKSHMKSQLVNSTPAPCATSGFNASMQEEVFSSTDAYMLMYNLRTDKEDKDDLRKIVMGDHDSKSSYLPAHLYEEMETLNTSYENSCAEYQKRKESELSRITERRQEVKLVLSKSPVDPGDASYFWISMEWLRQWTDTITPP